MALIANDILQDVSLALVEPVVSTTVNEAPTAGADRTLTPAAGMKGIYVGANLIYGTGATEEIITVKTVAASSFTADLVNTHAASETLKGATFPSGQTDHPLFTQNEMLAYLGAVQNQYLLKVRPIYNTATKALSVGTRNYTQPTTTIRLERISIADKPLLNTSMSDLDLLQPGWPAETAPPVPTDWFQDKIDNEKYGFFPMPQVGETATLWFSEKVATALVLNTTLLLPDAFAHFLKYGVLSRAWSKDGEQRDPMRAEYCDRRFQFGVMLGQKFIQGIGALLSQRLPPQSMFRRFPLPAEVGVG